MRQISDKRRRRESECQQFRNDLVVRVGKCEVCGHGPLNPWKDRPPKCSGIHCHEIANGPNRQAALDKPYAILVSCNYCNQDRLTDRKEFPEARQLAILQVSRPEDYDLRKYLELTSPNAPNRIEQWEVDRYRTKIIYAALTRFENCELPKRISSLKQILAVASECDSAIKRLVSDE